MDVRDDLCPIMGCYWACSCRQDADTAAWKEALRELDETSLDYSKWRAAAEAELDNIGDES